MNESLADIYARREYFASKPSMVREILEAGAQKARVVAEATMADVKAAMHL
jgi:tryptophanyl-tRNA synthetase